MSKRYRALRIQFVKLLVFDLVSWAFVVYVGVGFLWYIIVG